MSMLSTQSHDLREAAGKLEGYNNGEISDKLREAADTIESLRDRLQERQHDHPYVGLVLGKYREKTENSDYYCGRCGYPVTDHDSYCRECGGALHESYGQVPEQEKRDDDGERESYSRWADLFGTPERAAGTLVDNCEKTHFCEGCPADTGKHDCTYDALLEWLKGGA